MNTTDRSGNPIMRGAWNCDYSIEKIEGVTVSISESETTESVYVTYENNENGKKVKVRFSLHENNATKFGDQLDGNIATRNEILYRLGMINRTFVQASRKMIHTRMVAKRDMKNFEFAPITISEMYQMPVGSDLSEFTGKIAKDSNYVILGSKVEEMMETGVDCFGNAVKKGNYIYHN